MSPLISISSELSADTVLYRTMDFFSAASMYSNAKLMFSRADTFSDKNEGIDRLLNQLQVSYPGDYGGMGWSNTATAHREHERVKQSHYVSCWSRTAESVAMWSLYSQDLCSVRVSTRLSKLLPSMEALVSKYSLARLTTNDLGSPVLVSVEARVEPVTYADISLISSRVSRRAMARQRLYARYKRKGLNVPAINEVDPRYWQREEQRRFSELSTTCRLKDSSFNHEAEVRLNVRIGEMSCSQSILDTQALLDPDHQGHAILKDVLKVWGWVRNASIPEREFINCPLDLIENVAIDPRCPAHKAAFIRTWFKEHGIPIVKSTSFGCLPDSFTAFPEW